MADAPLPLCKQLLNTIKAHVDLGQFKEALEVPNDNKYALTLKEGCWNIIPYLLGKIDDDTIIRWPALQRCCERLLMVLAEKSNPHEVILELIEEVDMVKTDAKFIAILKPIQKVLVRIGKRDRSLEWILNTIFRYVEKLPPPEDYDLSTSERLLMDCDENSRRIIKIYTELPTFYDYFVDQVSKNKKDVYLKEAVLWFLIDMLGKPFAHLDLEYDGKTKNQSRAIAEQIFGHLCHVQNDLYFFLKYVQIKCHPISKHSVLGIYEESPSDLFLYDSRLSPISLGVVYYLLFAERLPVSFLPQVYSHTYIYQQLIALAVVLIKEDSSNLQHKGLKLSKVALDLLPERSPSSLLFSSDNYELAKILCNIAVYCPTEYIRKESVCILKKFVFKFEDKGRYSIVRNLLSTLEHSGIIGYITTLYKDMVLESLNGSEDNQSWFKDKRLLEILKLVCKLKHGSESDIVESADHIISVLNLLRFIILRDSENVTGIWNFMADIETTFLEPLREGISMSRAHYEVKLLELTDPSHAEDMLPENVSLSVANSSLKMLPPENKKDVVNSGLNALHLVDSLLSRLQECISAH